MSQSVTAINSMVADLLQSVGGGVENDRMLRMMIVLLILLALMQNQQGNSDQTSAMLQALNGGGNNGESIQMISLYSSSTTISIQHSITTTMTGGTSYTGGESQETPTQLDVVA